MDGRWPPVYDFEDLARTISRLARTDDPTAGFWSIEELTDARLPATCQGDVLELAAPTPVIDKGGQPGVIDDVHHWLVIGNTCDFARDRSDVRWTQIVPLVDLGEENAVGRSRLTQLRAYDAYRGFYVPPWPRGDDHHRVADFLRPVALDRGALGGAAQSVARMRKHSWVLLHSCLVRFLARDDGRHD